MILTSPVSCVSDAFSSYCVYFFGVFCNWYNLNNQISSMMSLTIIGMTTGPLVCEIFLFALMNLLVVLETLLVVLKNTLVV